MTNTRRFSLAAFSLLEMILVIALMAVIGGIGVMGITHLWHGQELESDSRKLQAFLSRTLTLSLKSGTPVDVEFSEHEILRLRHEMGHSKPGSSQEADADVLALDRLLLHPDTILELRASESWFSPSSYVYSVSAEDVNQPLGLRLSSEQGQIEYSLHTLTLQPVNQRTAIR